MLDICHNVYFTQTRANLQPKFGDLFFQYYSWLYHHDHPTFWIRFSIIASHEFSSQHNELTAVSY